MGGRDKQTLQQQTIQHIVSQEVRAQFFSGPLPSPEKMEHYERVLKGAAERIIKMAEEQGVHRRELEKLALQSDIKRSRWGSIAAFIFGMSTIAVGSVLLFLGKDIQGLIALATALAPILIAFIAGSKQRKKERLQKYGKDIN